MRSRRRRQLRDRHRPRPDRHGALRRRRAAHGVGGLERRPRRHRLLQPERPADRLSGGGLPPTGGTDGGGGTTTTRVPPAGPVGASVDDGGAFTKRSVRHHRRGVAARRALGDDLKRRRLQAPAALPGRRASGLDAGGHRPGAPAQDRRRGLRLHRQPDRRHHPRPDQADRQCRCRRRRRGHRRQRNRRAGGRRQNPDLPRAHPRQGRTVGRHQGQFAQNKQHPSSLRSSLGPPATRQPRAQVPACTGPSGELQPLPPLLAARPTTAGAHRNTCHYHHGCPSHHATCRWNGQLCISHASGDSRPGFNKRISCQGRIYYCHP